MPPILFRPELQELIDQGAVTLGPIETSDAFHDYLIKHFDLFPSRIDWSEVSDRVCFPHIGRISNHEVMLFLKITRLVPYAHIGIVNSYQEPILITDLATLEEHFDLLTLEYTCFMIGAEKREDGSFIFHFEDFVEYTMGDDIQLTGRQHFPSETDR